MVVPPTSSGKCGARKYPSPIHEQEGPLGSDNIESTQNGMNSVLLTEVPMLSILGRGVQLCDGVSRREVLRIGGLSFTGLMWADLLRSRAARASEGGAKPQAAMGSFGKARACIIVFNYGGPSHLDIL